MESANPSSGNLVGITVLVIEDDYFVASECAGFLRAHGAKVVGPVPDIDKSRTALAAGKVDCVLLDINLKGEMAFELARELADQRIPLVFTTGYDRSILPQALRGQPCLQKPVEVRDLVSVVKWQAGARAARVARG